MADKLEVYDPLDRPRDSETEHRIRFETAVLFRLTEIERQLGRLSEAMEKYQTRVQALENTQSQIKILAVAFASLTGILSMVLGKLWR